METKDSETITENLFRKFYGPDVFIEKSAIPKEFGFKSKKDSGKDGYPDFFLDKENFVIIVEAKASKHKDAEVEVQFYMEHNLIEKDMLGIAVSGQTEEDLQVTYYKKYYGDIKASLLDIDRVLMSVSTFEKIYKKSKKTETTTEEHLTKTLHALNKEFQTENIVRDTERSLFFSGLMIALKDRTFSDEHKANISKAKNNQPLSEAQKAALAIICENNRGRKHSEETKAKISAANKGKQISQESRDKMSKAHKGKRIESHLIKVAQYDLNGNLIKIWDCIMDASRALGIDNSRIAKCAKRGIWVQNCWWIYMEIYIKLRVKFND